ncbi:DMT family transporter [Alcaligenes faecalis]|uniref:DMT family transporter n=1 Tax=Alcaligenes faecalis TaxID=511 RepID=UPI001C832733|nr:DMT family transporter [Alcaligenes faecalis]MBX6963733.1 EamA/RhaT family transporter [Providencia rettgeri]MBX7030383.1 EamA/RhaT family transporter [Alcaligenes faecalis]
MSNSEKSKGLIELLLAMIMMGTVGLFVIESGQNAYNVVFYRCVLGSIFLLIYCLASKKFSNSNLNARNLILIIASGIFLVFNWALLFESFKVASISTSTTIYHTQPFFFLIIWSVIFKEKTEKSKLFWMLIAFLGVALVANITQTYDSLSFSQLWGTLLALSAAVLWALSAVLVKFLSQISPFIVTLIQLIVGIFVLLPFAELQTINTINTNQWACLVTLGLVHTCLTYVLMYSSYKKLTASTIAIMTFIYPAVAIFIDYQFYDQSLNRFQIAGIFMIFLSSYASTQNLKFPLKSFSRQETQ